MIKIARTYYKKITYLLVFALTSAIFFFATLYLSNTFVGVVDEKNHAIGVERMINLSNEMVKDYDIIFKHTNQLANFVKEHPDSQDEDYFDFIKSTLMPRDLTSFFNLKNTDFVFAYVVARDDMISVTYPSTKKDTSDITYFNDNASQYYLKFAKENPNDIIVQGPLISPRSHQVLVYNRKAIYIDGKYWGYIGLCADFYKFLECVRLNVEDELFVYAIRSSAYKSGNDFIWGDNKLFKRRGQFTRQKSLFFGKQRWDLALRVKEGNFASRYFQVFYVVMFSLYVIAVTFGMLFVRNIFSLSQVKTVDLLTGTVNHTGFVEIVKKKLENNKRKEYGFIIVELLHFKQVNNIFGFKTGDEMLIEVTKRIRSILNYNDKICRLGAEYSIFVDNIKTVVDLERVCAEIEKAMEDTFYANGYAVKQNILLGYASTIENGREIKTLTHTANTMLDDKRKDAVMFKTPVAFDQNEILGDNNQAS